MATTLSNPYYVDGLPCAPIWMPRYRDQAALVSVNLVRPGRNLILFTCDNNRCNTLYSYDGDDVLKNAERESNGYLICFVIPLSSLTVYGEVPEKMQKVINQQRAEYEEYKAERRKR